MPKPTHFAGTGVELWFGGSDTPVPPDPPETTSSPTFTVAVAGYGAGDRVLVRYTVDGRNGQTELGLPRKGTLADGGAAVTFLHGEITGLRPGANVTYTIALERRSPGQLMSLPAADDPGAQSYRFVFGGRAAAVRSTAAAVSAANATSVASVSSTVSPAAVPQAAAAATASPAAPPPKATSIPGLSDRAVTVLANRGITSPQDLTRVSSADLTAALVDAGAPNRDAAAAQAAQLRAAAGKAYPTETLAAVRTPATPAAATGSGATAINTTAVAKAWQANAGLDLMRLDISKDSPDRQTLNLSGLAAPDRKAFIRDIQVRKGVVSAADGADVAQTLLSKGITEPAAVSSSKLASEAGVSVARATNIRDRDIQRYGRLSHGLFTLVDAYKGGLQDTAVGNLRPANVVDFVQGSAPQATFDGLDNLQKLFGDLDSCSCKNCNSILSPASYFVDLMHFVQTHVLDEDVPESGDAPFKGKQQHPLHLKTRRPDLWVLPLTCENTFTEISQLVITSEILENFIATKRGIAIDADRTGVVSTVYGSVFPGSRSSLLQPFHLPLEELAIYLGHFGLGRGDVARILDEPEEAQLRAALGVSSVQADLIGTADASAANIASKLAVTVPVDGIMTVRELMTATQLNRVELAELLLSNFVAGGQPLSIIPEKKSASSVQFDIERVHGVTLGHLDRVHRLLRLRRYVPWLPQELDGFISSRGGSLDGDTVLDTARASLLKTRFKASVQELCGIAGDLPQFSIVRRTAPGEVERTPLDVLFNVPDLMRQEGSYPDSTIRYTSTETSSAAQERAMRLRAALRVDDGGLATLVEALAPAFDGTVQPNPAVAPRLFERRLGDEPGPALPASAPVQAASAGPVAAPATISFALSRHNLSLLYRHAVLARWLKLDVTDLCTLIRLTPNVGDHVSDLRGTLALVRFCDWWKSTRLSLNDLSILLAPSDALRAQTDELWNALQLWLQDQAQLALTDTFLTQIDGVTEALSRQIVALNIGKVFAADGDKFRVTASSRPGDLDLSPLDGTTIDKDAVRNLVRANHPDERLPQALTQALGTVIELARAIVAAALPAGSTASAGDFLKPGAMPESLRPAVVTMLRFSRLGTAMHIEPPTLTFFAEHLSDFGVTNWAEPGADAVRRFAAVQDLLKRRYRDDPAPALAQIAALSADKSILGEAAATLFAIDPALARDVVGTLRIPANTIDALFKIEEYADLAGRLSVDATALTGVVSEDYTLANSAAAAVLAGFRAKYPDEQTWQDKVGPYQERVLERKRDALIDYLTRGPGAAFPDALEMYKYFLIDSEVDGCFRTSRIVAACSSLQLYVHRIRMDLEKEPNGGLHVQPSLIPDSEWEWRQHYRMWEANRKIFLWPENYLDPTIRDDKTPLFEALESELLQQAITDQAVIDAYSNYLKQLEELAHLRYAGAYHHYIKDDDSGEVTDIIYLFGATGGDAPTHYWREVRNLARSQEDEQASPQHGPWRKVDTRIPTRHVSPLVYDGRLYVFWNEITTTSQNAVQDGNSRFVGYSHRYTMKFTSLRLDGGWTEPAAVTLRGSAPAFAETDSAIDDPLVEQSEITDFQNAMFAFLPWFGIYHDPKMSISAALKELLTPRWDMDTHTKAREGYSPKGFMWERPYVSPDPSYGDRLLVNCAGLLIRGAIDLFDRAVLHTDDTAHQASPSADGQQLFAYRVTTVPIAFFDVKVPGMNPDLTLLRRNGTSISQVVWPTCPFDYSVAAALALNADNLAVFQRHWSDDPLPWSASGLAVANVDADAGMWSVEGSRNEVIIETDDELFLLQPSATVQDQYLVHRLGTTLVREVSQKLFTDGVDGLLDTAHQLGLAEPAPAVNGLRTHDKTVRNPLANEASYGIYYQEVFEHIPLLIAHHLNAQGEFEQAQRWFHYVFNPTSPESQVNSGAPETDRNWKYRQFRGQEQAKLRDVLTDTAAIQKYREDPFNAHAIARLRVSAYQKAVVMDYIDNLLDWGDDLFTRFQMETVNQAMMLYVTAAECLGPRPLQLGECGELSNSTRTYDLLKGSLSNDSDFLLEVEQLIPAPDRAVPATVGPPVLMPIFGLAGILSFPLSTAGNSSSTPSTIMGMTVMPVSAKAADVDAGTSSASATAVKSNGSNGSKGSASAAKAVGASTKYATALAASKGETGYYVSAASGGASTANSPSGASAIGGNGSTAAAKGSAGTVKSSTTAMTGSAGATKLGMSGAYVPFVKVALSQPRTDALVQSFALRQQFKFLGGRWAGKGGRMVPSTLGDRFGRSMVRQVSAAFCVPRNENLEGYWDRVEDRIQKIRTGRDIAGLKRPLSLFAPPIDPMLLARARAAGIALDDALGAFEGIIPQYRFTYVLQKAKEFAGTVQAFGNALQSALERKDSEELIRLQTMQQQHILALTTQAKEWELSSARANFDSTQRRRTAVQNRHDYYAGLLDVGANGWEIAETDLTRGAALLNGAAATLEFISAVTHLVPEVGSPWAMKYGGLELGSSFDSFHAASRALAEVAQAAATATGLEGRNDRRREDWTFQRDQSRDELTQIDKQIEAANIACDLADHSLKLHQKSIEQNEELLEYHEGKFSALGLYTWLASQLQRSYRDAYNMAYRMARYAEQAYRFEREDYTSELLSSTYWDAGHAGLLAGNQLALDLQMLDQLYIETDVPKREVAEHHFSLRQWDPKALIALRQKGECTFDVPELFYDLSAPGDYRRRIRSVRVTIPAVAGPFINVMATLSLVSSQIRYDTTAELTDAPRPRSNSITTSSARNDAGAFELNFRGEKYAPFEGAGTVSRWSLRLPTAVRMFDYNTISDVVLHFDYTASFDESLRDAVQGAASGIVDSVQDRLQSDGIVRAFSLKDEFPAQNARLLAGEEIDLNITGDFLPFFLQSAKVKAATLAFAGSKGEAPSVGAVQLDGKQLDAVTTDDALGASTVALAGDSVPWHHRLQVSGMPADARSWLILKFASS